MVIVALSALSSAAAQPPEPPPIAKLKPLCLETDVVKDGRPAAAIVVPAGGAYDEMAAGIARAVKETTGAALPVVGDDSPQAAIPLRGNLIALGNRSTNKLIGRLYDRYYTLLDLRYPGPGGYVVRTLHNPFGHGLNVVFCGGSDRAGVAQAAGVLIARLKAAAKDRSIRLGRLAEIRLAPGTEVPTDIRKVETWEASAGYGSVGYFGWNSISKQMALYYMTGDPIHAKEFLRLAFPDAQAKREIAQIDGERIEDKDHPLSGPYHYCAHMMILYWDLIEESPVFSDEDRLRVTRALAEQLNHWTAEWAFAGRSTRPPAAVGSRHGQWAAVSLYCLGRYFRTYYPDPVWQQCVDGGVRQFSPLHRHAWVAGENDNLFWYNTAIAPCLSYMVLTGDRVPLENGVLGTLLRGQEALVSGRAPDWALNSASLGFLHKAAYLTGDGRWLQYRDRTGVNTKVFRVGQSFWPDESLKPKPPEDLVGRWTIDRLPEPKWQTRHSGLPLAESFHFGSFRSRTDAGGDFVLIDGFNGASRNPYHALAVLELRLAGYTLLRGYLNQVITRVDGLMEPKIAMDAALRRCDVIGQTAVAVGEVPEAAYANWRRTLVQRVGRYALVIDELTFRQESPSADVLFEWETERGGRRVADGRVAFGATTEDGKRRTDPGAQISTADPMPTAGGGTRWTMTWQGPVQQGETKMFFSLVGIQPGTKSPSLSCYRLGGNGAALALPEPAYVMLGPRHETGKTLTLVDADHHFALSSTGLDGLWQATTPVDLDWDFVKGTVEVVAPKAVEIGLVLRPGAEPRVDGERRAEATGAADRAKLNVPGDAVRLRLEPGRHTISGALPREVILAALREDRTRKLQQAKAEWEKVAAASDRVAEPGVPAWQARAVAQVGGAVADMEIIPGSAAPLLAVAEGNRVHLLGLDGKRQGTLAADGPVRLLRWWPEPGLLLAGCADEKVIAFDREGVRRWVFVSEMDPAVFRAAKTYWFKSAPGHEGIHGLSTGRFIDGKPQAFVGSACTLEILDPAGKLVRRMPQFWGKVSTFALVDAPDGSKNLLAARKVNGTNTVAIINSRTLDPSPRGFISVPPGHTYMPGWSSMNRHHLFYEDLDGDGVREVTSEINGTWNRVCVWTAQGKPLWAANFGPGPRIPALTMRDLDVFDLDGDGRKEIVAATSYRMVVAMDCRCRKLWAVRLPAAAGVLCCLRPKGQREARIVATCDDQAVRLLDAHGKLVAKGTIAGRPVRIRRVDGPGGDPLVVIGTDAGTVAVFAPGR